MRSNITRRATILLAAAVLVGAAGCGGDDGGDAGTGKTSAGRASPDTEGALLTILSYGRAAQASEVCPLLSSGYAKRIGGGDAKKCVTSGATTLCPCESTPLETNSLSVEGNKATAKVTRPRTGQSVTIILVREGDAWKIDKLDPQKA
jgi:hypothetical protein